MRKALDEPRQAAAAEGGQGQGLRRSAAAVAGQALLRSANLATGVLAVRVLSPADFGKLAFVQIACVLVLSIGGAGLDTVLLRNLTVGGDASCSSWRQVRDAKLIVMLPLGVGTVAFMAVRDSVALASTAALLIGGSVCAALAETNETILAHQRRYGARAFVGSFPASLSLVALALVVAIRPQGAIVWVAVVVAARDVLRDILGRHTIGIGALAVGGPPTLSARLVSARHVLVASRWLAAIALVGFLYLRLDAIVVAAVLGDIELGRYTLAYSLYSAVLMVAASLGPIQMQRAQLTLGDSTLMRRDQRMMALVGFGFACVLAVAAPRLLEFVYGANGLGALSVLRVLLIAVPMNFRNSVVLRRVYVSGRDRQALGAVGLVVAALAVAMPMATTRFGLLGAAGCTVVAEFVMAVALTVVERTAPRPLAGQGELNRG